LKKARDVYDELKQEWACTFDLSGSIGRRYARADETGIYASVTIDFESLEDHQRDSLFPASSPFFPVLACASHFLSLVSPKWYPDKDQMLLKTATYNFMKSWPVLCVCEAVCGATMSR
jgi:hypothetical protein